MLNKRLIQLLGVALSILFSAVHAQPAPVVEAPLPDGLQTVSFHSPAVARTMKFDIVLPPDYETSNKRYPVLYLLHGVMQNYTVWGRNLGAAFYARNLGDLILVLPDGGNTWFVNYASSPGSAKNNWEDHLIKDVIGYVDTNFRTIAQREGRAIAGLSMGGFAAFSLGLRHPDMFISLGSTSGALGYAREKAELLAAGSPIVERQRTPEQEAQIALADERISKIIDIPGFSTQQERSPRGFDFMTAKQATAYDPFQVLYMVPKRQLPHMYIDAGTEDGLVQVAREFMTVLLINDVPFDFMQSRGQHNSEYWRRSIGHMMTIQFEVMQRALGNRP
ncbi:MAG: alpha/beta hydrolase-fold protein [Pseudohongiellaceae bacterium]|nr:alpha/beta hydrolase-fold protein [Pseudohongiellaceae bacterium]